MARGNVAVERLYTIIVGNIPQKQILTETSPRRYDFTVPRSSCPQTAGMLALASTWDEGVVSLVAAAIATEFKVLSEVPSHHRSRSG